MSSKINLQTCEYARKSSIFQDNQLIYFKSMYHMFSGCSNLVSLNLSHFGSPYAADTTGMFNHCYKLKNINCFSSKILESYHSR